MPSREFGPLLTIGPGVTLGGRTLRGMLEPEAGAGLPRIGLAMREGRTRADKVVPGPIPTRRCSPDVSRRSSPLCIEGI